MGLGLVAEKQIPLPRKRDRNDGVSGRDQSDRPKDGWHLCPKCCGLVPGQIDTDEWLICRAMRRDTSWAWCDACKEKFAEERERMRGAEVKSSCGTLAVTMLANSINQKRRQGRCDVCGREFLGGRRQRRCSEECKKEAARRIARQTNKRNYELRRRRRTRKSEIGNLKSGAE